MPDELAQSTLYNALVAAYGAAIEEGHRIGNADNERAISPPIGILADIADRARQVVSGIVSEIRDKAQGFLGKLFGSAKTAEQPLTEEQIKDISEQATQELEAWSEDYSTLVVETEIHAAVEEAVIEVVKENPRYNAIYWHANPDACPRCKANEAASPIRFDRDFPSGDTVPPAHTRCRCTTSPTFIED